MGDKDLIRFRFDEIGQKKKSTELTNYMKKLIFMIFLHVCYIKSDIMKSSALNQEAR